MEDYVIKTVVVSAVSWATLFVLTTKVLSNRSFDFRSRIVAIFHAFLAVTLASLCVQDWSCPLCPLAAKPSPQQVCIYYHHFCTPKLYFEFFNAWVMSLFCFWSLDYNDFYILFLWFCFFTLIYFNFSFRL